MGLERFVGNFLATSAEQRKSRRDCDGEKTAEQVIVCYLIDAVDSEEQSKPVPGEW